MNARKILIHVKLVQLGIGEGCGLISQNKYSLLSWLQALDCAQEEMMICAVQ